MGRTITVTIEVLVEDGMDNDTLVATIEESINSSIEVEEYGFTIENISVEDWSHAKPIRMYVCGETLKTRVPARVQNMEGRGSQQS
jgi:hypothetical protein